MSWWFFLNGVFGHRSMQTKAETLFLIVGFNSISWAFTYPLKMHKRNQIGQQSLLLPHLVSFMYFFLPDTGFLWSFCWMGLTFKHHQFFYQERQRNQCGTIGGIQPREKPNNLGSVMNDTLGTSTALQRREWRHSKETERKYVTIQRKGNQLFL